MQIIPFSSTVVLIYALTSLRVRDRTNRHMLASVAIDHLVAIWNSSASAGHLLYLHCMWPRWIGPRRRWRSCGLSRICLLFLGVKNCGEHGPVVEAVRGRTVGGQGHIRYDALLHVD